MSFLYINAFKVDICIKMLLTCLLTYLTRRLPISPWGRREKLPQVSTTPWGEQIYFHLKTLFFFLDYQLYNVKMHVFCCLGDAKNWNRTSYLQFLQC